mmetsp:Transcript_3093/g.9428  ORF Transcript_3093/g.9428 Transcript_3093/m.9428 type:complete len:92 (-) Transcript_3093:184-459(-)
MVERAASTAPVDGRSLLATAREELRNSRAGQRSPRSRRRRLSRGCAGQMQLCAIASLARRHAHAARKHRWSTTAAPRRRNARNAHDRANRA